jgi:poly-gamma-glutamate capsule biosynthesis protein CapA/YwtB (metallophosphatase superfamily)
MDKKLTTFLAVGDVILGPDPEYYFRPSKNVLQEADLLLGQLEVPYTERDAKAVEQGRKPQVLEALVDSGFDIVSLAGNHLADAGVAGIEDTIGWLKNHNVAYVGAGMNLTEARAHVILERNGNRFGFLDYNCVGPKETSASSDKAGCAFVNIITHYELDYATPGGPPMIYTWAETSSLNAMLNDIRQLRPLCDILVVSFHKGLGHTPAKLAAYEQQISYAAIDAGADIITGHHAHILQGIEIYKGKPIFHGMCNFVAWVPSLKAKPGADPNSWEVRRKEIFGFEPDPEYPTYPFHPDAIYTIIAKCGIDSGKISSISCLPCIVNKSGQPEIMKNDSQGQRVFDYLGKISKRVGLNTRFRWENDEIMCDVA